MDYKKDIKDINSVRDREGSQRLPVSNGAGSFGATISKKCERLATAIYLITNFLSDTEPMKYRLRTLSLELVRDASFIKSGSKVVETNVLDALSANILETLSLLELAFIAGLVSEMNFTVLKREYVSLRDSIEVKKASRESRTDNILGDNFFSVSESASSRPDLGYSRGQAFMHPAHAISKGHSIGQTSTTMSDRPPRSDLKKSGPKVGPLFVSAPHSRAITDIAKESRRARILKLVKDNREVTIKDIATHFADLSEKTIQRELVALVEGGVLKKFGERRWSRYALA